MQLNMKLNGLSFFLLTSLVAGIVSATIFKNTVNDNRIVTPVCIKKRKEKQTKQNVAQIEEKEKVYYQILSTK